MSTNLASTAKLFAGDPLQQLRESSFAGVDPQDIVRRAPEIDHLTVTMAFTCSKMRPDGFGGLAMLITADTIRSESAHTLLDRFYKEALAQGEVRHGDS